MASSSEGLRGFRFLGDALGEELVEQLAGALKLARQHVRVGLKVIRAAPS